MSHMTFARGIVTAAGAASILLAAGCTMHNQDAPDLAGPSEYSTSLTMTASPDTITQDGASQSIITIVARDASDQPVANLAMRVDIVVNNAFANDFGRLSARNIMTGSDGRATVVYTAPPQPPDHNDPETVIRIYIVPVGVNFDNATSRSVSIRLVQPATIYVPGSPVARFSYTPSSPRVNQDVLFDGSASTDPDGSIVSYQWSYDDGDFETGITQLHDFLTARTYNVTLTVTDNAGNKASTTRLVTVQ